MLAVVERFQTQRTSVTPSGSTSCPHVGHHQRASMAVPQAPWCSASVEGVVGDTDRIGTRILTSLLKNVLSSQYAVGLTSVDRPAHAAGRGGAVCSHCGFVSAHTRAMYCPKCRMRLHRG